MQIHTGTIFLFGEPRVVTTNSNRSFPEKGYQLLALLCRSTEFRITRKTAATLLWDNIPDEKAYANLRQLLVRMRKSFNGLHRILFSDPNNIWLSEKRQEIDVCKFGASPSDVAIDLYRGDFLDGITSSCESFNQWLRIERGTLREQYYSFASVSILNMTRYGHCDKAKLDNITARILAIGPEREATYRMIIEAYGRAGYYEIASQKYMNLKKMLRMEYASDPDIKTKNTVSRVFSHQPIESDIVSKNLLPHKTPPPRIAFLEPRWLNFDKLAVGLLKALIEDVSNELSRFRTFIVLAPHSSFQVNHDTGIPIDNNNLKADYTISGFVKPNFNLCLRMVSSKNESIIWAGDFRIEPDKLNNSFNQLTRRVAEALAEGIEKEIFKEIELTIEKGAYYQYLHGQHIMQDCRLAALRKARKHFQASTYEDKNFAAAHARTAQTLYQEWLMLGADEPHLLSSAHKGAENAVELDPNSGLAHWIFGVTSLYRREFDYCEKHFETAEILSPNSPDLMVQYGDALSHMGQADTGMKKFQYALELNPMPPEHYWWVGASISFNQQNYADSINYCEKMKDDESVLRILASAHALAGNIQRAKKYGRRLKEIYPNIKSDELLNLPPDSKNDNLQLFVEGLRLAGIE